MDLFLERLKKISPLSSVKQQTCDTCTIPWNCSNAPSWILQTPPRKKRHNLNKAHLKRTISLIPPTHFFSASFDFLRVSIGLICHLRQKDLGHGAVDNPIYRFAVYYTFLWLLGPLSHRFVDCLLSWVLMSCCLNHCIITALIHFLAYPHTRSVDSPLLEKNGLQRGSESRQLVTSSLTRGCHSLRTPPSFHRWQSPQRLGGLWFWWQREHICATSASNRHENDGGGGGFDWPQHGRRHLRLRPRYFGGQSDVWRTREMREQIPPGEGLPFHEISLSGWHLSRGCAAYGCIGMCL